MYFHFLSTGRSGTDFSAGAPNRNDGCRLPSDFSDPLEIPRRRLLGKKSHMMGRRQGVGKHRALGKAEHRACNWRGGSGEVDEASQTDSRGAVDLQMPGYSMQQQARTGL